MILMIPLDISVQVKSIRNILQKYISNMYIDNK